MGIRKGEPHRSSGAPDAASKLGSLQSVIGASALRSAALSSVATMDAAFSEAAHNAVLGVTSIDIGGTAEALDAASRISAGYETVLGSLNAVTETFDAAWKNAAAYKTAFGVTSADILGPAAAWKDTARYDTIVGSLSAVTETFDAAWKNAAAYKTAFGVTSADILGPAAAWKDTARYDTIVGSLSAVTETFDAAWKNAAAVKAAHLTCVTGLRIDFEDLFGDEHANTLIEHGWCALMDAPESSLRAVAELFRTDPEAANERMRELVRSQVDSIERDVVEQFPRREEVLRDAFGAHRQGKFTLSVPVLMAQIDGFWYERSGRNLFGTPIEETIEFAMVGHARDGIAGQLLRSLANERWPLRQSKKERAVGFSGLNRHKVLHGEDTDYGTEEHSLKMIALLHFSSAMLSRSQN